MGKWKLRIQKIFRLLAAAFKNLRANDPLRLAAATAFFTTFALPPILIIVVQVFRMLFEIENLSEQFFERIADVLGTESSATIKQIFTGFLSKAQNWWITIGGFVFLMFVATTLFKVIKDSLNQLWDIQAEENIKLGARLEKRAIGIVVILLAGILFVVGTLADGAQALLGNYLNEISPVTGIVFNSIINKIISILLVTTWFSLLFKLLPDAKPTWRVSITGGFFTGILFTIGKFLIPKLLPFGELTSIFGTSSSVVLLLLFVFYSSFILYYGACFTLVYAEAIHQPIKSGRHGHKYDAQKVDALKDVKLSGS
jgi:membrane protein